MNPIRPAVRRVQIRDFTPAFAFSINQAQKPNKSIKCTVYKKLTHLSLFNNKQIMYLYTHCRVVYLKQRLTKKLKMTKFVLNYENGMATISVQLDRDSNNKRAHKQEKRALWRMEADWNSSLFSCRKSHEQLTGNKKGSLSHTEGRFLLGWYLLLSRTGLLILKRPCLAEKYFFKQTGGTSWPWIAPAYVRERL